jgi:type IV pilus assembly protein PilY1
MTIQKGKLGALAAGTFWALTSCLPAVADDTELFITTSVGASIRPNILFVIDNSGSMDTAVFTQETYDPNQIFAGSCSSDRVYWRTGTGSAPSCSTSRWFDKSALKCDAASVAFTTGGMYIDKLVQYDPDTTSGRGGDVGERWETIDQDQKSRSVECRADAGLHGMDGASADTYTRDGSTSTSGYWGGSGTQITWTSSHNNQSYTLYSGNYLNWLVSPSRTTTRLEVVQEVATSLLGAINGVNVGLVHFNDNQGGLVAHAMEDIATARSAMQTKVNALTADTWTPLSETLYEAALYYHGGNIQYGTSSVAEARTPGNNNRYLSPIHDTCQQNYVVVLTDGEPTQDVDATARIQAMTDHSGDTFASLVNATCDIENGSDGACFDDLAEFLYEGDASPLPESQSVKTYTIGFAVDLPVLEQAATRGGGAYYTADDTATLATALTNILVRILDTTQTFTSPTVAVNAFNRTQNLSDLFISVFNPTGQRHWHGNLKKYRLRPEDAAIVDANGFAAVNPATGFFRTEAQSYWSAVPDGPVVTDGGAANVLPLPNARRVFTYMGTEAVLSHSANRIDQGNIDIDDTVLATGVMGEPTRDEVIDFINGVDVRDVNGNSSTTDARNQMGDPLHSQPVSAVYGPGLREGLLFFATNDGVLHALNLESGVEQWAFIPPEFLTDQTLLLQNETSGEKHYGIDGDLRVHMIANNDNIIEGDEKVFLYFGMGRGGDFYYGLDVTDPANPALMWRLDGATLPKLGQTWSTPIATRIDIQGANYHVDNTDKHVLVIGGGYEPDQDYQTFSTDITGNAIYIVDAYSGELLWSASNSGATQNFGTSGRSMDYSIPARIRVLDRDGDGYADRFYAGDMGGQIWRFDVTNGQPASSLTAGGVIAQLGAAPNPASPAASIRRFYYTPDIANVNTRTENFIHIGIGSGHRGHPLNDTNEDRFYALRDYNIGPMTQGQFNALTIITDGSLTPVTTTNTAVLPGSNGWRLDLNIGTGWAGEKVLAEARTFNNQIIFSTFRPSTDVVTCTPQLGTNRIYQMNLFNGAPVTNLDGNGEPTALTMSDLFLQNTGGILSTAQALFVSSDANNDGVPDSEADHDGDGIPDSEDPDFAAIDSDGDGIPDASDPDVDGDGILNVDEDDDGDGSPNRLDEDDDGDGILDVDEMDGNPVICVGLICFPAGFQNTPVRTFWSQEIVD